MSSIRWPSQIKPDADLDALFRYLDKMSFVIKTVDSATELIPYFEPRDVFSERDEGSLRKALFSLRLQLTMSVFELRSHLALLHKARNQTQTQEVD